MEFWIILWKIVFVSTIVMFAGMSVWVTIKGFSDIKKLILRIDESHKAK